MFTAFLAIITCDLLKRLLVFCSYVDQQILYQETESDFHQ
uniref:Uncharacterized protein n=1 Tax=Arundo donax TaxID=35708 RepID=A0A0A9E2M1_ARUDO